MSPLDSILGLEGLFVEQVQRAHDIHVWARTRKRSRCVHCANAWVRIKATYTRTLKHTRQGNQLMWLHLRLPKYHCLQCNRYFRHRRHPPPAACHGSIPAGGIRSARRRRDTAQALSSPSHWYSNGPALVPVLYQAAGLGDVRAQLPAGVGNR